ncbi:uncharacterized protein LOC114383907 [Glycine soja]|uniref:uncharacterized protein n=1 Tax=Glycine max TaxID=3847 RepID=UPI0003DE9D7E|nr:uncharacterized protein LOC102668052 [Glycine max]XP_028199415.1 uncharacterized protein LOC114383907 [Glycine soja]|eukprot:XP_006596737.1 uncharacterized protein LOC102668052 [Glycine max]
MDDFTVYGSSFDAFIAYHHSKEISVVAILADLYDTFDRRCVKNGTRILCCMPALYVWLVSHLFRQESRPTCPLHRHRLCTEKGKANWEQLLASVVGASINWFPRWKEGKVGVLSSCEGFSNVPLMGTRGCINYNHVLTIRQLGYPMRGAPSKESITPFITRGFSDPNARLRAARKEEAETPEESEEVQALKAELEQARAVKEKFKSTAIKVRKEYDELKDINMATTEALEQETKKALKEEHDRNKFRGALWGRYNELKLQRDEKDQSRVEVMILKDELKDCHRSKRSLSQQLSKTEGNIWAIINDYK